MPPSESTPRPSLRIAVISRHFTRYLGGAENYAVSLVEQLAPHNEITVFCQSFGSEIPGVRYVALGWQLNRLRWLNLWLFSLWTWWHTRGRFDVVHSHENVFHGNVHTVHVKPMRINLFAGVRGVRRFTRRLAWWISPRLLAYRCMEHLRLERDPRRILIAASLPLRDDLLTHFQIRPDQLHHLPPGVTMVPEPNQAQRQLAQAEARQALGLPEQASLLLMIGHDFRKKGLGACLRALTRLPEHWHLVVVGNPAQQAQWQTPLDEAGVRSRVHFLGILKDTTLAYRACNIMVHATLEDVFPMVTLEAMAHRLPLIISPAPFCLSATLLKHREQALVLPDPQDDATIAAWVSELETHVQLAQTLGEGGRAFCATYSWPALAQQQEDLYRSAIKPLLYQSG